VLASSGAAQPRPVDPGTRVALVPLGAFPPALVADLVAHYKAKLGLVIETLPPVPLEPASLDRDRQQVVAEELTASLRRRLPNRARDLLIGLTVYDMYIRRIGQWEWAFGYRDGERLAVVSIARMDPANWGGRPDPERLRTRLRKMVGRDLGIMYYGLRESSDRRSVLFGPILGLDDLDSIGEDF
jgi:predicted Zn-dependent protease